MWIDNDSARATAIKGTSKSPAMFALALQLAELDNACPAVTWVERVPSFSNVAIGHPKPPAQIVFLFGWGSFFDLVSQTAET